MSAPPHHADVPAKMLHRLSAVSLRHSHVAARVRGTNLRVPFAPSRQHVRKARLPHLDRLQAGFGDAQTQLLVGGAAVLGSTFAQRQRWTQLCTLHHLVLRLRYIMCWFATACTATSLQHTAVSASTHARDHPNTTHQSCRTPGNVGHVWSRQLAHRRASWIACSHICLRCRSHAAGLPRLVPVGGSGEGVLHSSHSRHHRCKRPHGGPSQQRCRSLWRHRPPGQASGAAGDTPAPAPCICSITCNCMQSCCSTRLVCPPISPQSPRLRAAEC
jgi:hypothetical protein